MRALSKPGYMEQPYDAFWVEGAQVDWREKERQIRAYDSGVTQNLELDKNWRLVRVTKVNIGGIIITGRQ